MEKDIQVFILIQPRSLVSISYRMGDNYQGSKAITQKWLNRYFVTRFNLITINQ